MARRQVQVKLTIPFLGEVSGTWEPDESERAAAWELYVELVTRVSVVPMEPGEGSLREALSSLHGLFGVTREVLRRYGPRLAPRSDEDRLSVGLLSVAVLNGWLRPLLSVWHPRLTGYEARRPADITPDRWEAAWEQAADLRTEIEEVRQGLLAYARELGEIAGVASLLPDDQ